MESRRALFASLALLVFVVLGIAAVQGLPALLDWDARRPQLAAIASERLGRQVSLDGPVTLTLLPQPRLEAAEVRIGDSSDEIGIATRALHLRLDLGALLLGRIAVRELSLVGAEIRLPWPPANPAALAPPPWLTALDARLEDGRILLGDLALEGVRARLVAGGPTEALTAEGALVWRGRELRFAATVGRAGDDGISPLDLALNAGPAELQARGVLLPEGGFEGRLVAAGPDLAAILPSPPGAFRATAQLVAGAELIAANGLALQFADQSLNGAAALRLAPSPRFDLSFAAQRLDVTPWLAALRGAGASALPVALDLAAEAATLGPLRLRRLRGSAFLEGERLTLSDVAAELPGEGRLEANGASAGPRLDLALRLSAAQPALLLESLGWPERLPLPAGAGEAQLRLSAEGAQLAATDLVLRFGASRMSGGFTWRRGPRPSLALGLEGDAVALPASQAELATALVAAGGGADIQLRLGLARLGLADAEWERLSLDGAAEAGRIVLRRLAGRQAGLDLALSGTHAGGRLSDGTLEAEGAAGPTLRRLGLAQPALDAAPLRLRATASGPAEALALRLDADLAEARLELQTALDLPGQRSQGSLTARHPGAVRLFAALLGGEAPDFLGEGSFSLITQLATRPEGWSLDGFELVAGALRARGQVALAQAARPVLSGRVAAETLPLPEWRDLGPRGWPPYDLDLALRADRVASPDLPHLEQASAQLRGDAGALRLEQVQAQLAGGALSGALSLTRGERPVLATEGSLADAVVGGPVTGRPLDISAGRLSAEWRLAAQGHTMEALLASLAGTARVALRDAVLQGLDAPAAAGAITAGAEAPLRAALAGGASPIERGALDLAVQDGQVEVREAELLAEGGLALRLSGRFDLPRDVLDLRVAFPVTPEVALRWSGPSLMPRRLPELAEWLRQRAETPG
jgi:hypothetical protein